MYIRENPSLGQPVRQPAPAKLPPRRYRDQIQFVEVTDVRPSSSHGRVALSFRPAGRMDDAKKQRFIKRFIDPMLKHKLGVNLLIRLNRGNHFVNIAWGNGGFRFNGTVPHNRKDAAGGGGSGATIFIDEQAPDLSRLQTLKDNPDVLLFHELVHALHIQLGTLVNDEAEMERRVIGIGKYSKWKRTENAYRDARGLPARCCRDRETL